MKNKAKRFSNIFFVWAVMLLAGITFLFSNLCFSPEVTFAEQYETLPTISDGNFTVSIVAKPRKSTKIFYKTQTVTTSTNEEITYCVYNWSELEYLTLSIAASIPENTEDEYKFCRLTVSNIQTDNLQTSTGLMKEKELNKTVLTSNKMNKQVITYYIDSETNLIESEYKKIGNDFGLYKFSFNYTATIDGSDRDINVGSVYIAVVPDSIDTKTTSNLKINYNVTSSNKLMNVFHLSLANSSSYKYVNPSYIQWKVIGKDINNVEYALNDEVKNSNPSYANYKVIWNATQQIQTTGQNFLFDSNDIEGTWIAYCTILNSDGTEKITLTSEEMSTIKVERKSYTLIIVLSVVGAIAVGSVVGFLIYRKKKGN